MSDLEKKGPRPSERSLANLKHGRQRDEAGNVKPIIPKSMGNLQREARATVKRHVNIKKILKAMETAAVGTKMVKFDRAGAEVPYTAAPDTDAARIILGYAWGTPAQSKSNPGDESPVQSVALLPPKKPIEVAVTVTVKQDKKK